MRAMWTLMLVALAIGPAVPAIAADDDDPDVDLELVLAVDISGSMDYDEQRVQRDGYVAAFRHPDVIRAITSGPYGQIAVTYLEWAGAGTFDQIVAWRVLGGAEDANSFADALANAQLRAGRRTSISSALRFASNLLRARPVNEYARRTIDISGDGPNNEGSPVLSMRNRVLKDGIVINGLPILIRPTTFRMLAVPFTLDQYYKDCVIGGPGSFMITVANVADFEQAIRRKLVLEIAAIEPQVIPVAAPGLDAPKIDCLIGERMRGG
jgi:hypothetical protein